MTDLHKRYCVFASYDKEGVIGDELLFYLKELNKIVDGIVFIMDNELDENEKKKLKGLCLYEKCARHNEYDFGSYKRGFFWLKENGYLKDAQTVIFANDSNFGPLRPFEDFIKKWKKENCPDFYGVTINNSGYKYSQDPNVIYRFPHVQSYFFMVTKNIFDKDFFLNFLSRVKHHDEFSAVVKNYEMGLSKLILENGFSLHSYFDFKNFDKNPTTHKRVVYKTIKNGFFIKKKAFWFLDEIHLNYCLSGSIFPYYFDKNVPVLKSSFRKSVFRKYILLKIKQLLKMVFNSYNNGCTKLISIFGIKFKLKRYNYEIKGDENFIHIVDGRKEKLLRQKQIEGLNIIIRGRNNKIKICKDAGFCNSLIEIYSDDNFICFQTPNLIENCHIKFEKENSQSFVAQPNTKILKLELVSHKEDVLIKTEENSTIDENSKFVSFVTDENRPCVMIK